MKKSQPTPVIPKKCVLYKQPRSSKWYCRIKLETGEWYRAATRCDDLEEATTKALEFYYEARIKSKNNILQTTRSFSSVAKSVVIMLQETKQNNE